jgi:hypothetical protein
VSRKFAKRFSKLVLLHTRRKGLNTLAAFSRFVGLRRETVEATGRFSANPEGVEAYKKEGAKFMRRLVAKAIQNDRQQILAASLLQSGNELLQFTFRFFH